MKKQYLIFILISCFLFVSNPLKVYSQNSVRQRKSDFFSNIDSLQYDADIVLLNKTYFKGSHDSVTDYLREITEIYNRRKESLNMPQRVNWLFEMGFINRYLENWLAAEINQLEVQKYIDENDQSSKRKLLNELAEIYRRLGEKQKSNDFYYELIENLKLPEDSNTLMSLYTRIAENYENLARFDKAFELCIQVYNFNLRNKKYDPASYNLIQMGRISSHMEEDTSYFEYYHMGVDLAYQSGVSNRIINNLVNLGLAYRDANFPKKGLKYMLEAQNFDTLTSHFQKLHLLNALCATYFQLDSLDKTYEYSKKVIHDAKAIDAIPFLHSGISLLASYYERVGKIDSALLLTREALQITKKINNNNPDSYTYRKLSDLSILNKDYTSAIAYLDTSFMEYEKQIEKINYEKLHELRERSDYYIHRNRISQLVSENKLEHEKNLRLWITIISIAFALGVILFFTILLRKKLRQLNDSYLNLVKKNLELDQLNKQLNHCEKSSETKSAKISGEEIILKKLREQLIEKEIYIDPAISLKSLADQLETNTSYLSAIINKHYQCNFRTLINKYRVDRVRQMLLDERYKHYSMEGIALEVGFNTRSVFYQTFKSVTGISPGVYLEKYKQAVLDEKEDD